MHHGYGSKFLFHNKTKFEIENTLLACSFAIKGFWRFGLPENNQTPNFFDAISRA